MQPKGLARELKLPGCRLLAHPRFAHELLLPNSNSTIARTSVKKLRDSHKSAAACLHKLRHLLAGYGSLYRHYLSNDQHATPTDPAALVGLAELSDALRIYIVKEFASSDVVYGLWLNSHSTGWPRLLRWRIAEKTSVLDEETDLHLVLSFFYEAGTTTQTIEDILGPFEVWATPLGLWTSTVEKAQ